MHETAVENIVFMIIRGVVALAIVGVALYCLSRGIYLVTLPHAGAEALQIDMLGFKIAANGFGAVVFAAGIALAFVGLRAAPQKLVTRSVTEAGSSGQEERHTEEKEPAEEITVQQPADTPKVHKKGPVPTRWLTQTQTYIARRLPVRAKK